MFPGQRDFARARTKTDFYRAMAVFGDRLRATGKPVILCGDWNTAHQEVDIKNARASRKTSGFTDEDRALVDEFVAAGWVDTFRALHPDAVDVYSWWSQRPTVRERNIGWRIDYHFASAEAMARVKAARVHMDVLGSDHCPVGGARLTGAQAPGRRAQGSGDRPVTHLPSTAHTATPSPLASGGHGALRDAPEGDAQGRPHERAVHQVAQRPHLLQPGVGQEDHVGRLLLQQRDGPARPRQHVVVGLGRSDLFIAGPPSPAAAPGSGALLGVNRVPSG
ncbi:MAG: exodeoxyribonuclease III [bacterium]